MSRNTMQKNSSLADALFNKESVAYLAQLFKNVDTSFNAEGFVTNVLSKLTFLPLKERIVWIATVLEVYLPTDFAKACTVITRALPPPLDPEKTDDDFRIKKNRKAIICKCNRYNLSTFFNKKSLKFYQHESKINYCHHRFFLFTSLFCY